MEIMKIVKNVQIADRSVVWWLLAGGTPLYANYQGECEVSGAVGNECVYIMWIFVSPSACRMMYHIK